MSVMLQMLHRLVWFTIVACLIAFMVLTVMGRLVFARAAGEDDPILVRDELTHGAHHLSGMVMVPSSCDELTLDVQEISSAMYEITFSTWQEPSVPCDGSRTPRAFRDVLFAPAADALFTATLDGVALPILVLPVRPAGLGTSSLDARSPVIHHP